ncbi:MarR family winged helix-turn-helix transcriptional regulator [Ornithinimicrobium sp. LYQ92]|uniref:MarR family winged helix-turn-helix transcriptional regulator n=1 Tax=Serinicoccus sp. LYQ92 TaxID=3378798 RepID=UPI003852A2FB
MSALPDPDLDPTPPDLLALDRQVCFALAVASRKVIGLYRPFLEPLGLTHPQYLVMLALWEESSANVARLGQRLSLDPATLSPLLKRLETQGLVTRERDSTDERVLTISLTPRGRGLRAEAERIPEGILDTLGMDVADLEHLRDVLHDLIRASNRAR